MTDNMTSQNIELSSWDTLYIATSCNIVLFMTMCIYRYTHTTAVCSEIRKNHKCTV